MVYIGHMPPGPYTIQFFLIAADSRGQLNLLKFINGSRIDTGNIRISGNTIESTAGALNFVSATDQINLEASCRSVINTK